MSVKGFERTDGLFSLCGLNCGLCGFRLQGGCNGCFEDSATAFIGEENETGILIDYNAPEGFYKGMFGIDVS